MSQKEFNKNLRKAEFSQNAGYVTMFLLDGNGIPSMKKEDVLQFQNGTVLNITSTSTPQTTEIESGNSRNPLAIISQGEETTLKLEVNMINRDILAKLQGYYYEEVKEEKLIEQAGVIVVDEDGTVDFGELDVQKAIFTQTDGTSYIATVTEDAEATKGYDKALTISAEAGTGEKKSHKVDFGKELAGMRLDAYWTYKDDNHIYEAQQKTPIRPYVKIVHSFNAITSDQLTRKKITTTWFKMQLDGAVEKTSSKEPQRMTLNFKSLEPKGCKIGETTITEVPLQSC